jgi:hypothetical protein
MKEKSYIGFNNVIFRINLNFCKKKDEFTSDNVGQEVEDGVFCFAVHFRTIGQDQVLQTRNCRFGQLIIILLDTPPIQNYN